MFTGLKLIYRTSTWQNLLFSEPIICISSFPFELEHKIYISKPAKIARNWRLTVNIIAELKYLLHCELSMVKFYTLFNNVLQWLNKNLLLRSDKLQDANTSTGNTSIKHLLIKACA